MKKIICIFILSFFLISTITTSGFVFKKELPFEKPDLDSSINFIMKYGHIPAISACIVDNYELVWSGGFGNSDVENDISATDETIFMIASITKTVTGTAILQLYELGYFELDDDVNNFLPFELRNPNYPEVPITYRMLLSHSSSLIDTNNYWDIDFHHEGPPFNGYPDPWLENYLTPNGSNYDPLIWSKNNAPGEKSTYANINFDIIAYLIEIISGEPYYEYCENHIFEPLDMDKSSFRLTDFNSEEVAIPYFWNPFTKEHEKNQNLVFIHYPAGGLFTNVLDLSHFLIAHMNGGVYNGTRILNEDTIEEMHKIQPPGNKHSFYYGLAWLFLSRSIWIGFQYPLFFVLHFPKVLYSGHGGDISYGLHTRMNMKISENTGIIYFMNTQRIQRQGWHAAELLNEVLFKKADQLKSEKTKILPSEKNIEVEAFEFEFSTRNEILNTLFYRK
jgi:CubicO group peptidase (beta-lactamase class C family)